MGPHAMGPSRNNNAGEKKKKGTFNISYWKGRKIDG